MSYCVSWRRGSLAEPTVVSALLLVFASACADGVPKSASEHVQDDDTAAHAHVAVAPSDAGHAARGDAVAQAQSPRAHAGDGEADPGTCARAELKTTRVIPIVWLLIDGSGSMASPLNGLTGDSRWQLLRDALLAPSDGLIARLEGAVEFGLFVFDGGLSPPGIKTDACPRTVEVAPALHNFAAISAAYPELQTGASTPTHYALEAISARIAAAPQTAPTYVVLATDGRPNLCDFHDGLPSTPDTEQEAVATVSALAELGTKLFAISLAGDDPDLQAHLNDVAMAGNTGKSALSPTTQGDLVDALSQIVAGTTSCSIRLEGTIVAGHECAGEVRLNGEPLVCHGPNGFRVGADHQTLELMGAACESLRREASSELRASFACDDLIVI